LMAGCSPEIQEAAAVPPASQTAPEPAPLDPEFTEYLQQRMAIEQIPGLSIAVVEAETPPAFYNFGYLSPDSAAAVSEHTLYEIGSITKTFTASLFAILMEQPAYADAFPQQSDTPVNEILARADIDSEFRLPDFEGDAITLKHLLTHHSGLPRLPQNMTPAAADDPYRDYTRADLTEAVSGLELSRAPGEEFAYSNLGFMILGYVSELLTGRDYDALVATYITGPLEMTHTARLPDVRSETATPTMSGEVVSPWRFEELRGLGELHSNARDMARYVQAQLGQHEFEYSASFAGLHAPATAVDEAFNMGLSWFREESAGQTLISHGGGTGGFRSYISFHPESGRGVAVLTNSGSDVADIARHLLNPQAALRPLPDTTPQDEALLSRLTGFYLSDMLPMLTVSERDGILTARLDGQSSFALERVEPDGDAIIFKNNNFGVELEFFFDDSAARAEAVELRQAGQEFRFSYSEEAPEGPEAIALSTEELRQYVGSYDAAIGMSYEMFLDGERLMARLTGQPASQIYPEGNDRFFYTAVPAALEFRRDENGLIEAVELQQGGQQILFLRNKDEPNR
ncbi:MAG: serine hydrolase, partial [Cyclonatronaceae bacterium]